MCSVFETAGVSGGGRRRSHASTTAGVRRLRQRVVRLKKKEGLAYLFHFSTFSQIPQLPSIQLKKYTLALSSSQLLSHRNQNGYQQHSQKKSLTKMAAHQALNFTANSPPPSKSPTRLNPRCSISSSSTTESDLLTLIADQERGLKSQQNSTIRSEIIQSIEALADLGKDSITTGASLSGTWRMLWTTEKEQLFIVQNAGLFGTKTGNVLQVIDVDKLTLNNVITFPPSGVFFVRSGIEIASQQRVNFRFTSAVLRGEDWEFPLPPFGQGWFESVYLDDDIRVAKDIRGDYLVVDRAPYEWKE